MKEMLRDEGRGCIHAAPRGETTERVLRGGIVATQEKKAVASVFAVAFVFLRL
jgi:hypothetical protein